MTVEEYITYSNLAIRLFNFMNGRINIINNHCELHIDPYDYITKTNANIRYPNNIFVHIGNIVDSWDERNSKYVNRHDFISTVLAWAIAHELFHADQLISMIMYNKNHAYKSSVEGDVERSSYNWVAEHANELSQLGGFNVIINELTAVSLPEKSNYRKASIKEYYVQTITNIILRDFTVADNLSCLKDDTLTETIWINFNDADVVCIKDNNKYLENSIPLFTQLAYNWAGNFDIYKILAEERFFYDEGTHKNCAEIKFLFRDQLIKGVIFKEDLK